ncbi:MAG: hypothetical protein D8M58_15080 [Calditrichaeota bacterium]|nr:MAG: hypothetical protein DWQ03_16320 [Calditrichota bacterium]MBL1206727.1 hypothetical protein [Calditrichota bacterium]NOG46553.1 hypothetical protein [Calditrichota bacterium]
MKIIHAILLMLFTVAFFACSNQTIESKKPETQILVDGIGNDWEKYNLVFNEDFNIVFGALNTDPTLYLMFRFNDQRLARMFASRGVYLWLDKEKETGIMYRDENLFPNPGQRRNRGDIQQGYFPNGTFIVQKKDTVIEQSLKSYPNLEAAFNLNDGLYCFEFKLPLNSTSPVTFISDDNELKVGIELAEVSEEVRSQMEQQRQGARGSAMSGGRSGGGRGMGGRGGMRGGGRPAQPKTDFDGKEIWLNIILNN